MTNPSGPIVILCGYDTNGVVKAATIDADGALVVSGGSSSVDAADVTYSPADVTDWDGDVDPGNQDNADDQLAARVKVLESNSLDDYLPVRATWFNQSSFVVTGNVFLTTVDTAQQFGSYTFQSPAANGDVITQSCVLKAGAYTIKLLIATGPATGKYNIDFKHIDDAGYTSVVTAVDTYSPGLTQNVVKTATFTVATSGRQIFKFTTNGKNAASSGYSIAITVAYIYLTAGDS